MTARGAEGSCKGGGGEGIWARVAPGGAAAIGNERIKADAAVIGNEKNQGEVHGWGLRHN